MMRHLEALGEIVQRDPAVAHVAMSAGGSGNALNAGRLYITLKPRDQRTASADQVIARLRPDLATVDGAALFLQSAQDVRVGGRASRTQYQYTMQGADLGALNEWAPKMLAKMETLPALRDVASDQQVLGTTLSLVTDRDQAARYGCR
jgi:hydrophobic/amphiphilic exporter-1 (mainly G- bacteria), HAE1 family